jgi:hypothetical protein
MTGFITNYIQNTAMGMLSSGITAAGNVAGNAVGGVGTMIQSSGQAVGTGTSHYTQNVPFLSNTHPQASKAASKTGATTSTATAIAQSPQQHQTSVPE